MAYILIYQCYLCYPMPYLKALNKIFLKLLHTETNLCGSDSGMIGLYELYSCFHHYNTQRSNYNHLQQTDTTYNQGMHTSVWL